MKENHSHECMYDVLQRPGHSDQTLLALNRLKAKIVLLHSRRLQKMVEDNNDADRPDGDRRRYTTSCRTDHTFLERRNRANAYDNVRNNADSYDIYTEHVGVEQCKRGKIGGGSPLRAAYVYFV